MSSSDPRAFSFLRINERPLKPRRHGLTEIRGPYYTPMGKRYLQDVLETMGAYVDSRKFAGGSFALMPRRSVKEQLDICHDHDVLVSTGGFIERVLSQGRYIKNYGPEVNLYVDHGQIVQLECLRAGIWGTSSLWGRVVTFKE